MTSLVNDYSDSRAVLIGVSKYLDDGFRDVPAAENSLHRILSILANPSLCGWPEDCIEIILNPIEPMKLAQRLRRLGAETTGTLLIYFVGHGVLTEGGELCLALSSTEACDPDLTGLEFHRIRQALMNSPARTKIAILDCCYSGRAILGLSGVREGDLADATEIAGAYTLTAADQSAHVPLLQDSNVCTSFTECLTALIREGIPGGPPALTLGSLYPELKRRLRARGLPSPNQRGTDTIHLFPFSWNSAYEFHEKAANHGSVADFALTISKEGIVQFNGAELGNQLATLLATSPRRSLIEDRINPVRNLPGFYQIIYPSSNGDSDDVVYIGSAQKSLRAAIKYCYTKLTGRRNIDLHRTQFSYLYVGDELAFLGSQVIHATPQVKNLSPQWNRNGFGNRDPGRSRDGAILTRSHFDAKHPIDLSYRLSLDAVLHAPIAGLLSEISRKLPYVFRYDRSTAALAGLTCEIEYGTPTVNQVLAQIATAVGSEWQITAFPGYVTMYPAVTHYPSAWRYYIGDRVVDQEPEFSRDLWD